MTSSTWFDQSAAAVDRVHTLLLLQALSVLAERTERDVRACLNTLQFLGRRQRSVRTADVECQPVGQKDITASAFAVWQQLFWLRVGAHGTLEFYVLRVACVRHICKTNTTRQSHSLAGLPQTLPSVSMKLSVLHR